jgi:hypothetical protein
MICFRKGFGPEDLKKPSGLKSRRTKAIVPITRSALEFLLEFSESAERLRKYPCEEYGDVVEFYAVLCFEELDAIHRMTGQMPEEVGERYIQLCYDCLQSLSEIRGNNSAHEVIMGYINSISEKVRLVEEYLA